MSNENVANTAVEEVSGGFTGGYITGGGERKTLWQKIFGTRSEREIKRIDGIKEKVLSLEQEMRNKTDDELRAMTTKFKDRLAAGETLDDILPEAYATVR